MRKFAEIIESTTVDPPTNCLWIKGNDALYFTKLFMIQNQTIYFY